MKNKERIQILVRLINKSDQIMDDIFKMTMQIYVDQPGSFTRPDDDSEKNLKLKKQHAS